MADPQHLAVLRKGVPAWNQWRQEHNHAPVDLSDAVLDGEKLNGADLLRADLRGAKMTGTQLQHSHLTGALLTGAVLERANFEHAVARHATFDDVRAAGANFKVSTLRGARFRNATLCGAKFYRAYLRDADLTAADLTDAGLRFAVLEGATCEGTTLAGADLRYASLVASDLRAARLTGVQVYGVSAWGVSTDDRTEQDLIVSVRETTGEAPLRTNDLRTAQLLALMLDGSGVRGVLDSVTSKVVLVLGSFAPAEKSVLDRLRTALQSHGYVAVTFDFERPEARDYAETVVVLAGLSRFLVADFTNAKEVRSEVLEVRRQYRFVPIIPIARTGAELPVTLMNAFDLQDLDLLVRYDDDDDLVRKLGRFVVERAEARADEVGVSLARVQSKLRGV